MQLLENAKRMSSSAKMATASAASGTVTATMIVVTTVTSSAVSPPCWCVVKQAEINLCSLHL